MDVLATDMNSMLNSMSSWWGSDSGPQTQSVVSADKGADKAQNQEDNAEKPAQSEAESAQSDSPASNQEKGNEDKTEKESESPAQTQTSSENTDETSLPTPDINFEEVSTKAVNTAKEWGSYLYTFGKSATHQVTEQVTKTAKQLKDTIDEQVVSKTMIGDFNKEQSKFLTENHEKKKKSEAAIPPWVGYNEEQAMKTQILALSSDRRNFLRNPPAGVQFNFDFEASFPVAMSMLQEDPNLTKMRFDLVPKQVKEIAFWRNYFYRVSLIKQSAQLTSLAHQTGTTGETTRSGQGRGEDSDTEAVSKDSSASQSGHSSSKEEEEEEKEDFTPGSPTDHEFVSDTFQTSGLSEEDVKKELQQLGMSEKEEDIPEWEKELQAELQEYEVVDDGNGLDDADLEQEIMDQLEAEGSGST